MAESVALLISEKLRQAVAESGRGVRWKKRTVEESYELSLFRLRQEELLTGHPWTWRYDQSTAWTSLRTLVEVLGNSSGITAISVTCTLADALGRQHGPLSQVVRLTSTPCHFGGRRWWFMCPGPSCQRKVAKLHMPPGRIEYACRHCHGLSYEGRQKHRDGSYESFGRFGLYRRRAEQARSKRQKARWLLRLLEADERTHAYMKAYDARFWKRLDRLKRMDGSSGRSKQTNDAGLDRLGR